MSQPPPSLPSADSHGRLNTYPLPGGVHKRQESRLMSVWMNQQQREPRYELRVPGDSWPCHINPDELLPRDFPKTVLDLQKPNISRLVTKEYSGIRN